MHRMLLLLLHPKDLAYDDTCCFVCTTFGCPSMILLVLRSPSTLDATNTTLRLSFKVPLYCQGEHFNSKIALNVCAHFYTSGILGHLTQQFFLKVITALSSLSRSPALSSLVTRPPLSPLLSRPALSSLVPRLPFSSLLSRPALSSLLPRPTLSSASRATPFFLLPLPLPPLPPLPLAPLPSLPFFPFPFFLRLPSSSLDDSTPSISSKTPFSLPSSSSIASNTLDDVFNSSSSNSDPSSS
ncbi:hypothetical protein GQX74_000771 [Glossina fuscipes]|nr:hypothetical protein GQX74_000771 [Glossina fuscipes]